MAQGISKWRKPTQAEAALGYVAMTPRIYHCYTDRGTLVIGYSGGYTDKESKATYPKQQMWAGYTQIMLERRASWSKDLPDWFEKAPKPLEADWYAYLDGKEASKALGEKLKSLGSYEGKKAA